MILRIYNFLIKNKIFFIVLIFLICRKILQGVLESNELDVLAVAKHFINKNWIPNDWFLNLRIGYRNLFSFIAGIFSLFLPLWQVAILGRFIIYILFSYIIQELSNLFNLKSYLIPIFIFIYFYYDFDSIVAKEWMIGSFETKSFAYFFVILSLIFLIKKNYRKLFLSLGLSISFHVLIGVYCSICIFLTIIINIKEFKKDFTKIIRNLYLFFITSSSGLYVIVRTIIDSNKIDKKLAGEIYVNYRVPHHTLPSYWEGNAWIIKIIIFIFFLLLIYIIIKKINYKIISSFALSSSIFFIFGLVLFKLNIFYLLKYYWFRFPDVILPFFSLFLFLSIINDLTLKLLNIDRKNLILNYFKKIIVPIITVISMMIMFFYIKLFIIKTYNYYNFGVNFYLKDQNSELIDILFWIKNNTDKNSRFLTYHGISCFYVVAERAMFVSFKHSPQSEKDILEWYNRIELLNNYYNMDEKLINEISTKYNINYYLGKVDNNYSFNRIYCNSIYALYLIK